MEIKSTHIRTWSMLGQRGTIFAIALPEIAQTRSDLKVMTADLALLSGMERFINAHPQKFINVGIAEQNLISIATGLAMAGRCVFATTYASFIAVRSLEQIRHHLSYMKCNVKVIASSGGVSSSAGGVSHWATEDLAFMRALPNMTVLSPADSLEAYKMTHYAASINTPVYIRLSNALNCPIVHKKDIDFQIGKAITLKHGNHIAIIATGAMVSEALKATIILEQDNISCTVIDMHTIKPLDTQTLKQVFSTHKLIVTIEEHSIIGGLGSAVSEYKATLANTPPQLFIGLNDTFDVKIGSQIFLWKQYGLTAEHIAQKIVKF